MESAFSVLILLGVRNCPMKIQDLPLEQSEKNIFPLVSSFESGANFRDFSKLIWDCKIELAFWESALADSRMALT